MCKTLSLYTPERIERMKRKRAPIETVGVHRSPRELAAVAARVSARRPSARRARAHACRLSYASTNLSQVHGDSRSAGWTRFKAPAYGVLAMSAGVSAEQRDGR